MSGGGGSPGVLASMGLAGTTAVIVVNATHPIEVVKTRMQVDAQFSLRAMIRAEGGRALYNGIQAAYLRESTYTSIKLGGYGPIKKLLGADRPDAPFALKFAAGACSGSMGAIVGNPFDVLKTKMMTSGESLPSLVVGLRRDAGLGGFFRGASANIARACVLNGTKMACYDKIKGEVATASGWSRKDRRLQFVSAGAAGFFMTCTVAPFDMVRTTLMNQPTDRRIYTGFVDCAAKIAKEKGPSYFYRGFLPIWGRFAPQATLQLMIFEVLLGAAGFDAI